MTAAIFRAAEHTARGLAVMHFFFCTQLCFVFLAHQFLDCITQYIATRNTRVVCADVT
jgi:hypothetical protein